MRISSIFKFAQHPPEPTSTRRHPSKDSVCFIQENTCIDSDNSFSSILGSIDNEISNNNDDTGKDNDGEIQRPQELEDAPVCIPSRNTSVKDLVAKDGMVIKNITARGDCMFGSISHQLRGNESMADLLREQTCEYLMRHQDEYKHFIVTSYDEEYNKENRQPDGLFGFNSNSLADHVAKMRVKGEYGTNIELFALANMLGLEAIVVYKATGKETILGGGKGIHRLSYHEGHYNSVVKSVPDPSIFQRDNQQPLPSHEIKNILKIPRDDSTPMDTATITIKKASNPKQRAKLADEVFGGYCKVPRKHVIEKYGIDLPKLRHGQREGTCVPAGVQIIRSHYGESISLKNIINELSPDGKWVQTKQWKDHLDNHGYQTEQLKGSDHSSKYRLLRRKEGCYLAICIGIDSSGNDFVHVVIYLAKDGLLLDNDLDPIMVHEEDKDVMSGDGYQAKLRGKEIFERKFNGRDWKIAKFKNTDIGIKHAYEIKKKDEACLLAEAAAKAKAKPLTKTERNRKRTERKRRLKARLREENANQGA